MVRVWASSLNQPAYLCSYTQKPGFQGVAQGRRFYEHQASPRNACLTSRERPYYKPLETEGQNNIVPRHSISPELSRSIKYHSHISTIVHARG